MRLILVLSMFAGAALAGEPTEPSLRLFKAKCGACHGPDGKGKTANGAKFAIRDMSSAAWQAAHPDATLNEILTSGKPVKANGQDTPHFSTKLKPTDVAGLIDVLRSFAGK